MFRSYRAVFRAPGTALFCLAGLVMRLPIAMYPIGFVLLISQRTGHYGFAGVLSANYVVGGAPGNPLLARLADRFGQRRVIGPSTAVHVAAVVAIVALFETHAPNWTLVPPTLVCGFAYVSVSSLVRARWSYVLTGGPELGTAFSLESILDELIFVVGPLLATLLATQVSAVAVLVLAAALVTVGGLWLSALVDTEPPVHAGGADAHPSALRTPGLGLLLLACCAMGAAFAGCELSIIAFCGQHGHRALAGAALAWLAGGSGVAGFLYGARHWRADLVQRVRINALIFAVLPVLFFAATSIPVLLPLAFVIGLGIAPTLITMFGLIEERVPAAAITEGLAWLTTGLNVGYGVAAAAAGGLADAHGARASFVVPVGAALLTGALTLILYRLLRRHPVASDARMVGLVGPG